MATRTTVLKRTIEGLYRPHRKHEILFQGTFQSHWAHPDLVEIVKQTQNATTTSSTMPSAPLTVEIPDSVYSFSAFTSEFVKLLTEEIANFYAASERFDIPIHRPNSMNKYGVVVNEIGLRPLISSFQQDYLWPISKVLFPQEATPKFDGHHSFIVRYQADEDLGLDMHTDDSDVTFNVCLGETFTGSTLTFCGEFGAANHRQYTHQYHHQVGRAILHLGSRRHGADDIDTGRRMNLIVWNHNSVWRASSQYRELKHGMGYQREQGLPSKVCLSYTHDVDYLAYHDDLPERAKTLQLHPWCPPPGMEYEGFEDQLRAKDKKKKTRDPVDEL
ncbi:and iron-dependent oxygenase domain-containing protein 2 [Seminavis robusta]|uniref:And iron-dependent oxygenase domain-containing protein 2 n=1 Tax=Seminavis robusta TaxID=568900 RepID=A0A9N8E497_9STRA|nr:and iron-dependent oxygenase domain-containing protein 2 [Seminavis robusta]|eukprot:Sro603_g173920.1 and iron-dependent oxygenase domain-containing protein 2 (331) ;mRNA; f:20958-22192